MLESDFNKILDAAIKRRIPDVVIRKQDPLDVHQGVPDKLILAPGGRWAMLESKRWTKAKKQPNQDWWIEHYNARGFARFVNPENYIEVLDEMESFFNTCP